MTNQRSAIFKGLSGTYVLTLAAEVSHRIVVGKLGSIDIRPGFFLYVGSAFGPGGLAARLGHHLRPASSLHWHIDNLKGCLVPADVWVSADPCRREHEWAAVLVAMPGAVMPLAGFGASDCRCSSHLYFFEKAVKLNSFRRRVRRVSPDHAPIRRWKRFQCSGVSPAAGRWGDQFDHI